MYTCRSLGCCSLHELVQIVREGDGDSEERLCQLPAVVIIALVIAIAEAFEEDGLHFHLEEGRHVDHEDVAHLREDIVSGAVIIALAQLGDGEGGHHGIIGTEDLFDVRLVIQQVAHAFKQLPNKSAMGGRKVLRGRGLRGRLALLQLEKLLLVPGALDMVVEELLTTDSGPIH